MSASPASAGLFFQVCDATALQNPHAAAMDSPKALASQVVITMLPSGEYVRSVTTGKKCGLDPDVMTEVLNVSTGMSWISQTHIQQRNRQK